MSSPTGPDRTVRSDADRDVRPLGHGDPTGATGAASATSTANLPTVPPSRRETVGSPAPVGAAPVGAPSVGAPHRSFADQPGGLPPRPGGAPVTAFAPNRPGLVPPAAAVNDRSTGDRSPAGAAPGPAPAAKRSGGSAAASRPARRAQLTLRRVNVWSVFKLSCILSITLFFVWMIGVGVLYGVLDASGVVKSVNDAVTTVNGNGSSPVIKVGTVFGVAAIVGAVNIVLFIALTTVFALIYNLCADLVGGVEVTLSERE